MTSSTADSTKINFFRGSPKITRFSADLDRSRRVDDVGIFNHKKILIFGQDIRNLMKKFCPASLLKKGTNSTLVNY